MKLSYQNSVITDIALTVTSWLRVTRVLGAVLLVALVGCANDRNLPPIADDSELAEMEAGSESDSNSESDSDWGTPVLNDQYEHPELDIEGTDRTVHIPDLPEWDAIDTVVNAASAHITIDGQMDDWDGVAPVIANNTHVAPVSACADLSRVWVAADDSHILMRLELGRFVNLQALAGTIVLEFDADGDVLTGAVRSTETTDEVHGMAGIDLVVHFSPQIGDGGFYGAGAWFLERNLPLIPVNPYWLDASVEPIYATDEVELRFKRGALVPGTNVVPFLGSEFTCRMSVRDRAGHTVDTVKPFTVRLDQEDIVTDETTFVASDEHTGSIVETEEVVGVEPVEAKKTIVNLSKQDQNAIRFVSWNVELGSLFTKPEPFIRVLQSLRPDVILFQELGENATEEQLTDWLNRNLGSAGYDNWSANITEGSGTAVATRLNGVGVGPKRMPVVAEGRRLKAAMMIIAAGRRRILVTSVHLSCCGSAGDKRDSRRIVEATALHHLIRRVHYSDEPSGLVTMGDFNLVGSSTPLDILRDVNDFDASDLLDVSPLVTGSQTAATWRDSNQPFLPGRLDIALVSDSVLQISQSFVLDTQMLSDSMLNSNQLKRQDCVDASDHLPMVVDILTGLP